MHPKSPGPPAPVILQIPKTAVLASSLILVTLGFSYVFFFVFFIASLVEWFIGLLSLII
jgi:hypothetical protein